MYLYHISLITHLTILFTRLKYMYNGRESRPNLNHRRIQVSITQIGVSTVSDELIAFLKTQIKNGTINWGDLIDTPGFEGQDGKFLAAFSEGGSSGMEWKDLPAAGLNWQVAENNVTAEDKIGFMAKGGITITLPNNPAEGSLVAIADHFSEFDVSPVTVRGSGGLTIEGDSELVIDLRNAYLQLIFDGTEWNLAQVNHPFNIQEITEETFPGGLTNYSLARIPPGSASILVFVNGSMVPTAQYYVVGNTLTFGTVPTGTVSVRHIGVPNIHAVSDTPVGAMLYFPNGEDVDGWLDCTGGSISKSVYPDLVEYLTRDPSAETAFLPDSRGNFIRTWDHGAGIDTIGIVTTPNVLKNNEWGRWLDTTESATSANLWDGNTSTRTKVKAANGYVGYRFDVPVSVADISLTTSDPVSGIHIPTSVQIKASTDGITWVAASNANSGPFQNSTVNIPTTTTAPYRYWAVFGTGGVPYTGDSEYYWGVSSLVINGTTESRRVGSFQDDSAGDLELPVTQASSGTGVNVLGATGSTSTVSAGPENRPNNQTYVLRIKAFHYQSGTLSNSSVVALRSEVSRLSSRVNDGTSYVSNTPPANPSENARWYDTESGRTYIWFNDGDSYQWVDDSPQNSAATSESINSSMVLAKGSRKARPLNERFTDITNILDFGANRNSTVDSSGAFQKAGSGPVFIPTGSYEVTSGDFTGNIYFSFGPTIITGSATGIVVKDILA